MLTYNAHIKPVNSGDDELLLDLLKQQRELVNAASQMQFKEQLKSLPQLHEKFYYPAREAHSDAPSQVVIKAEQESVAAYKSMRSNKHRITKAFKKKSLSMRLDKRISSRTPIPTRINIITTQKRKEFDIVLYPKLEELMSQCDFQDPLVFARDGKLMISLSFDIKAAPQIPKKALGVDLGIRRVAACSDGRLIIDKKFNADKRKLRHKKRQLQSKGTKSARRRLKRLRRKERNANKNQTHLVANEILKTDANVIALENLKGIKAKKHKKQNKNVISQVPLFDLRRVLTYKAKNAGKSVCLVSPAYTSQTDSLTGKREGKRRGVRFYAKSGLVYDADINAARNIALRSKHPISQGNLLDGQGTVNCPNACQPSSEALQAHPISSAVGG